MQDNLLRRSSLSQLRYIGSAWDKTLLCFDEQSHALIAVDQHAVHERVRYEYFCAALQYKLRLKDQPPPCIDHSAVNLSSRNCELAIRPIFKVVACNNHQIAEDVVQKLRTQSENIDYLQQWGFRFSKSYDQLLSCGEVLGESLKDSLNQFLQYLDKCKQQQQQQQQQNITILPPVIDSILAQKACKGAIKFGERLQKQQVQLLLQNQGRCEFPFHCVHGRNSVQVLKII